MKFTLLSLENKIHLQSINSTNLYMRDEKIPSGHFVIADEQTAGKGRNDHIWKDIGSEKLIFSAKVQFYELNFTFSLLPLFTGIAIVRSIIELERNLENRVKLKWPNDVFLDNKKISGVLIESHIQSNNLIVIIGIGLNIFGNTIPSELPSANFLFSQKPKIGWKEKFLCTLIDNLNSIYYQLYDLNVIAENLSYLEKYSYLHNKKIQFKNNNNLYIGCPKYFSQEGYLVVEDQNFQQHVLIDTTPEFEVLLDER